MIDVDDAIRFHDILVDKFGGSYGIRELGLKPKTWKFSSKLL